MVSRFESKTILNQRIAIFLLVALLGVVLVIRSWGVRSFGGVGVLIFFVVFIYYLSRSQPVHATGIVRKINNQYRKDMNRFLDLRGWTAGNVGERYYFYFPEERFGLEYDVIKGAITGKEILNVISWERKYQEHQLLKRVGEEGLARDKAEKIMEDKGYVRT